SDLSVAEALKKRDGLAIISVFCNVQAELVKDQMDATEELMYYIPDLLNIGDRVSGVIMDMRKLLRINLNSHSYYTYAGSLTSPACNEAVIWIIFNTPLLITDAQYNLFGRIGIGRHNFRSLQKLNQHQVFTPISPVNTPQMVVFFEKVVKIVADYMKKGFKSR
ncbi:Carbonic anhydrase, partial [Operophtera brumata]